MKIIGTIKGEPATDTLCGGLPLYVLSFIKRLVEGYIRCLLCCLFSGPQTVREFGKGCILRTGNLKEQAHQLRTFTANTRQQIGTRRRRVQLQQSAHGHRRAHRQILRQVLIQRGVLKEGRVQRRQRLLAVHPVALVPRAEIEGDMGDSHVGLQARLMSQALRKITGRLSATGTTAIFINQLREKIGVFFGSPETTTGGKALKFYASVRIDIRRIETLKDGANPIGNRTRAKIVKNKMAPPFKQAEFDILYGEGISVEGGILDLAVENDIVKKSGAWFTYDGEQLGQGRENVRKLLKDNPELTEELQYKVLVKLGIIEEEADEQVAAESEGNDPLDELAEDF